MTWFAAAALFIVPPLAAQDTAPAAARPRWYCSNKAGMELEEVFSKAAAMRCEYCLEAAAPPPGEIPENIKPYFLPLWRIERRTLYEKAAPSRVQWLFIDERNTVRLAAVLTGEAAAEETASETGEDPPRRHAGFVDRYNDRGLIEQEISYYSNGETETTDFSYSGEYLLKAETVLNNEGAGEPEQKLVTDNYRYSRSGAVRSIERIFYGGGQTSSATLRTEQIRIPLVIPRSAVRDDFVSAAPVFISGFIEEGMPARAVKAVFTTDSRGRTQTERREDKDGKFIAMIKYGWSGDRLASISLYLEDEKKAEEKKEAAGEKVEGEKAAAEKPEPPPPVEERRVEYSYDSDGDWTTEKDYVLGKLERQVTRSGSKETEELYMDGKLMLTAWWENGRKVREESVRN